MDFALTDEQTVLRDEIIRFAQRELSEGAADRDRQELFPRDLWDKCGEMGLQGLPVPPEYGGTGLDPLSTAVALEALGYGCRDGGLVFAICAHLLACVVPIWKYGSEEQKQKYLPGLCDGSLIAVNGMTEPSSGSDAFSMATTAVVAENGFLLNGRKTFSSNGPIADLGVVYARTESEKGHPGITAFLIERNTPGYTPGQRFEKIGLRSCPIGELVMEDVQLPAEAVLGGVGGGATIFGHSMDWERICLVASHVGTMQWLLEKVLEYAKERVAFGRPIGKFQAISHRIAEMKTRVEAARLLCYRAAWRLDRERTIAMDASITKLYVSEALVESALDAVQILGGYGVMAEYEVERTLRDAIAGRIYSGTSEIQREIIARWLGL